MKALSEFEKNIIDRIIEIDEKLSLNVISNIANNKIFNTQHFSDNCYIEIVANNRSILKAEKDFSNDLLNASINDIHDLYYASQKNLFLILKLLDYLETENFIFTVSYNQTDKIGHVIANASYNNLIDLNVDVSKLLYYYSDKLIFPCEQLKHIKRMGYISDEEYRHRTYIGKYNTSLRLAVLAIVVSGISLIINALLTFFTTNVHSG